MAADGTIKEGIDARIAALDPTCRRLVGIVPSQNTPFDPDGTVDLAAVRKAEPEAGVDASTDEELCGHRNMSGRTCTRERGHSAKSHRYS